MIGLHHYIGCRAFRRVTATEAGRLAAGSSGGLPSTAVRNAFLLSIVASWTLLAALPVGAITSVDVSVDATITHQVMEGFGAGHQPRARPGRNDLLTPSQRTRAIAAVYGQVGLTTGYLDTALLESPGAYDQRRNDNADPFLINWSGFQTFRADTVKTNVLDPAQPLGFTDYCLAERINVRWASPWMAAIRSSDRNRYLDEAAEQVAAGLIYWRDTYGTVVPLNMLFNEPLSGNGELGGGSKQEVVDLVSRVGTRLRSEGFSSVRFLVPNEETVGRTLDTATAILADEVARPFVGAIGYHPYPYGSPYTSISQILATSGKGQPVAAEITARTQLRDLGKQYGVPVWMTEISHGGVDPRSFTALRARAIHIHDELVYADAAAYLAYGNMWDRVSQEEHFGNTSLFSSTNEGFVAFIDQDADSVTISGLGYAIGHYARWVKKGALRIAATSGDPLVQVTAFRDGSQNRVVLVLINNATASTMVHVALTGVTLTGSVSGEQSTAAAAWQALAAIAPSSSGQSVDVTIPAESVTTLAGVIGSLPTTTASPVASRTRSPSPSSTTRVTSTATRATPTLTRIPTLLATFTPTQPTPTSTSLPTIAPGRGDANCDGSVSAPDLSAEVQIIVSGVRATCLDDDVNADDRVDERDLEALLQALFENAAEV